MRKHFHFFWKVALVILIVGAGAGSYFFFRPVKEQTVKKKPTADFVLVEVEPVKVQKFIEDLVVVGSLKANESVVLRPEIEGKISEILFVSGTHVERGDKLVRLEDNILKAQLKEAQAQANLSKLDYERAKYLVEKKVGPLKEMQKALATYQAHKASLQAAKEKLAKALVTAPFEGLIGLRDVSVGAYLRPGDDLVVIEDVDPIKVDFNIGEVYLKNIKKGMPVKVKIDGFSKAYDGVIEAIDARVDTINHSIRVRASVDNPSKNLRSGLFASVTLTLKEDPTAIMIPESAVEQRKGEQVVYRVIDGRAVETPITIGGRKDGMVMIEEGLFSYDIIITAGASKIHFNGVPVKTIPSSRLKKKGKDMSRIVEKLKKEAK